MTEQSNNNSGGQAPAGNSNNNNPNRNRNRRRHNNRPRGEGAQGQGQQAQGQQGQPRPQGQGPRPQNPNQQNRQQNPNQQGQPRPQNPNQQQGQGQKRRHPQHNKPRPQGQHPQQGGGGPFNIERVYEKYLNLMDQHIIARRKYHDLFYRADPAQKNKLERNFYNTLNDVREFENKLAPEVKELFEKRNNGYQYDRIYTTNHEISIEGDVVPDDLPPAEPHLLQSQIAADYSDDTEESVGTAEDYLRYKGQ